MTILHESGTDLGRNQIWLVLQYEVEIIKPATVYALQLFNLPTEMVSTSGDATQYLILRLTRFSLAYTSC